MKAVEISSFGGPDVLRLADRPAPGAGAGEVLIRVAASGVNRPDVLQRTGNYPVPPGASDIPGLEVAGVIEQIIAVYVENRQPGERFIDVVDRIGIEPFKAAANAVRQNAHAAA